MNSRLLPWLMWMGIVVAAVVGCGKDEGTEKPQHTAPMACFSVIPAEGSTEIAFQVDASCSSDEQTAGGALQVRWDWENDGAWDTSYTTTKTASHQYGAAGPKTIRLEVSDAGGLTGTTAQSVSVTRDGPPVPASMALVPAGAFTMGGGAVGCGHDVRNVTLTHSFYLGRFEVTNQGFRDALEWASEQGYVTAAADSVNDHLDGSIVRLIDLASPACQVSFSGGTFAVDPGMEDYPIVGVSWFGAAAYCDWLSMGEGLARAYDHSTWQCNMGDPYGAAGYRLPTDAEWEYAAQYDDGRTYPWGNEWPDCSRVNWYAPHPCAGSTSAVGSYPPAPAALDLYDLAGNVWEWCNDWHMCSLGTSPESDPPGPTSGSTRVLRGGAWNSDFNDYLRRTSRSYTRTPSNTSSDIGLRCARSE